MSKTNNIVYIIELDVPDNSGRSKHQQAELMATPDVGRHSLQNVALDNKPLPFFHTPEGGLEFQHQLLLTRSKNKHFRCLAGFTTILRVLRGQILHTLYLRQAFCFC